MRPDSGRARGRRGTSTYIIDSALSEVQDGLTARLISAPYESAERTQHAAAVGTLRPNYPREALGGECVRSALVSALDAAVRSFFLSSACWVESDAMLAARRSAVLSRWFVERLYRHGHLVFGCHRHLLESFLAGLVAACRPGRRSASTLRSCSRPDRCRSVGESRRSQRLAERSAVHHLAGRGRRGDRRIADRTPEAPPTTGRLGRAPAPASFPTSSSLRGQGFVGGRGADLVERPGREIARALAGREAPAGGHRKKRTRSRGAAGSGRGRPLLGPSQ